jgi:hypothetical protein
MAKDKKDKGPPTSETPLQKFERLAKALVSVPKADIDQQEREWRHGRAEKKES